MLPQFHAPRKASEKRKKATLLLMLTFLGSILLVNVSSAQTTWALQTVDGSTQGVGSYCSLALDANQNPHVSYYDLGNSDLKHAKWTGSSWSITTVDQTGDAGSHCSLFLDSNQNPHISYYDLTNGNLKYTKWTGSSWITETVDSNGDIGPHSSLALDSNANPHISYYDATNADLKHAEWTGSSWSITIVDSTGNVGRYTSLALDSTENPHISYYDATNGDLRYAKWTGSSWSITIVDSTGNVGRYTSLGLDSHDYPHISYYDVGNADLKHAMWTGSGWSVAAVDATGNVGLSSSLALDSNANPCISYYDATNGDLKYAGYYAGSGWVTGTIASTGEALAYSSLALDSSQNPHVSYYEYTNSNLKYASGQTTLPPPKVATPTFTPAGGTYSSPQTVNLNCATSGATIRYTTDDSEPQASSTAYSTPITLSSTATIKAKAFKSDMADSDTATATYTINIPPAQVATPAFTPTGGSYSSPQTVELSCSTDTATIRYTTDGSEPTSSSNTYSNPIPVNSGTVTIKAKAFKTGMTDSETASATYTIDPTKVSTPNFTPAAGTYSNAQTVALSCATTEATIHYTTDGTEPTSSSTQYSNPLSVSSGTITIKAKAFKSGMTDSDTATATYTVNIETGKVAAPTFNPPGGTYSSTQNIALNCATPGATITFTVDGSEPTSSSTVYSGSISVGSTTTVKAKAFKNDMTASDTASTTYTINIPPGKVAAPTLSPPAGTYSSPKSVTLSCSTNDATIKYTTDGSEPSSTSTVYSGPIQVNNGILTVKAKAFKSGMTDSDTATATYTISGTPPGNTFPSATIYALAAIAVTSIIAITFVAFKRKKHAR